MFFGNFVDWFFSGVELVWMKTRYANTKSILVFYHYIGNSNLLIPYFPNLKSKVISLERYEMVR